MGKETKSRTERTSFIEERLFGGHHYETKISDGKTTWTGAGRTAKESEKIASDKYHKSSDDSNGSSDDCFIATAVYGNPCAPQVQILRDFRDNVLRKSFVGRSFIDFYYSGAGKTVAHTIERYAHLAIPIIKNGLDLLVKIYSRRR